MRHKNRVTYAVISLIVLALLIAGTVMAQDSDEGESFPATGVYVTTQDLSSLRTGPGRDFDRITVLQPELTLPAIGRTADTRWIQVVHDEQPGWIAAFLLVWSGDVIDLPVDGVDPNPFIRRANALGVTTRETPIFRDLATSQELAGVLPPGTEIELTGRLGTSGYFRFQIMYRGELYWVSSWNIRVVDGDYRRLLDVAYLYPYGRLQRQLDANVAVAIGTFTTIQDIWLRLDRGDSVRCAPIPAYVPLEITPGDVRSQPNFIPAVNALNVAVTSINSAISAFEDVCNSNDSFITPDQVDDALSELDNARRNLILVGSLVEPIRNRNPLLGG